MARSVSSRGQRHAMTRLKQAAKKVGFVSGHRFSDAATSVLPDFRALRKTTFNRSTNHVLLARCREANCLRGSQKDLPGDKLVIVDAAGDRVIRTRVDDALERSAFVDEPERLVRGNVVAHDESRIVDARENGAEPRFREVNGREFSALPQEAIIYPAARGRPDDRIARSEE